MDDGLSFERSSYCANSCCVEVAMVHQTGKVILRSSQVPDVQISFSAEEWKAFLAGVRSDEFDI